MKITQTKYSNRHCKKQFQCQYRDKGHYIYSYNHCNLYNNQGERGTEAILLDSKMGSFALKLWTLNVTSNKESYQLHSFHICKAKSENYMKL